MVLARNLFLQVRFVTGSVSGSQTITPAQVQQMLGLRSRWVTESLLRRAEAYRDCHIVPGGFSVMT